MKPRDGRTAWYRWSLVTLKEIQVTFQRHQCQTLVKICVFITSSAVWKSSSKCCWYVCRRPLYRLPGEKLTSVNLIMSWSWPDKQVMTRCEYVWHVWREQYREPATVALTLHRISNLYLSHGYVILKKKPQCGFRPHKCTWKKGRTLE